MERRVITHPEMMADIERMKKYASTQPITWDPSEGACTLCDGNGWKTYWVDVSTHPNGGKGVYSFQAECPLCIRRLARQRKEAANVGNYHMADFDWTAYPGADGIEKKREAVEKFIRNYPVWEKRGKGLYIFGGTSGAGKTFLAECIAGELLENWNDGTTRMVNEGELIEMSRRRPENGTDPLSSVLSCRLLILDDVGQKKKQREYADDILFRLIDTRYRAHRVTLYTSNYPLDHLTSKRIIERINA